MADNNDNVEGSAAPALTPEQRRELILEKFRSSKVPDGAARADELVEKSAVELTEYLINCGLSSVSTEWFDWTVDTKVWIYIHAYIVKTNRLIAYPWMQDEPPRLPEDAGGESAKFNSLKHLFLKRAVLPAAKIVEMGMPLMQPELHMDREVDWVMPAEQRQTIWDRVFPSVRCSANQAFEIVVPLATKSMAHVVDPMPELNSLDPAVLRIASVKRLNSWGQFAEVLILSLPPGGEDNERNRTDLALYYARTLLWASRIITTGESTPLARALSLTDMDRDRERLRNGASPQEILMRFQEDLTQQQLDRCQAELKLMPWFSQGEHASYLAGRWLEGERDRTTAEERCRLLRDWCDLPRGTPQHAMQHINTSKLSPAELRGACVVAWKRKITEWQCVIDQDPSFSMKDEMHWANQMWESNAREEAPEV
ncbi:hypothetical protein CTA2_3557 [Colletotrichum tanaceti]|uniref:Uncharacterized protein n=1 Tax=Colletotrichum tanaceti TaxID=1306861 RepID=A0A4U6XE90_9PEZI|nr:hypothetical protein CTA2_3557 [Colletotrichum tanaceti]TKW54111.1 hypothetical protein CTA1_6050 [Colletotrichum tanaceti]